MATFAYSSIRLLKGVTIYVSFLNFGLIDIAKLSASPSNQWP
jgi:hypothetical protein